MVDKLLNLIKLHWVKIIVFTFAFIVIFWKIGTYPFQFDYCVEHAIHFEVNKVIDNMDVSKDINWQWKDMHQLEGGRSPVYGAFVEMGLRVFGLTLFGVRIFPAIFSFIILILIYFTMRKFFSEFLSLTFIILLATSPWYLIITRSGGIVGFSFAMVALSICLSALLFKYKNIKSILLPLATGLSVGILPYGYTITRLIPFLLIFIFIINIRKINKLHFVVFMTGILLVVALQIPTLHDSLNIYFNARGESLLNASKDASGNIDYNYVKNKLGENIGQISKFLFGQNKIEDFWNPNIADSYWKNDTVLYPRFLVPLFIIGLLLYCISIIRSRKFNSLIPILFLITAMAPGLLAGKGLPDTGRISLILIPLYFFIAYSINYAKEFLNKSFNIKKTSDLLAYIHKRVSTIPVVITSVLMLIIVFTAGFQITNFFGQEKGAYDEKHTGAHDQYSYLESYLKQSPNAKVLICDYPLLNEYSYVTIRWLGGKQFQSMLESGQIKLLRDENQNEIVDLLNKGYFDKVIASNIDTVEEKIPLLKNYNMEIIEMAKIFNIK